MKIWIVWEFPGGPVVKIPCSPNETTDRGFIFKIHKQFIQLNTRKTNNPVKNWEKVLNKHFSKEDIQMTNTWKDAQYRSLLEKCKSKLQWDITSHRSEWPSSKSLQTINAGEGWRKGNTLHCWWECKLIQSLRKMVWRFLKKTRDKTNIWPSNPTPRHIPWGNQN